MRRALLILTIVTFSSLGPQQGHGQPVASDWQFDVLVLKNGTVWKGLLLEESTQSIRFQIVNRNPGRPTFALTTSVPRSFVEKLERLNDEKRADLKAKISELDPAGEMETRKMEKLDLRRVEWKGEKDRGWFYQSDYFTILSDAPEEIVRRAAIRIEQLYGATIRFFPPRHKGAAPVQIIIHSTQQSYQASAPEGIKNPAYFSPLENRIVCGTDLSKRGEDLALFRKQFREILEELESKEKQARKFYGKNPTELERHLAPIRAERTRIRNLAYENEVNFEKSTSGLFSLLYHECFHAYIHSFVYPPNKGPELPRWLNEGLAQIFETAIVEVGELRVGHPDPERLNRMKDQIRDKKILPLKELLQSGPKQFAVLHGLGKHDADQFYLASWGLALYLCFENDLLGTKEWDTYLAELAKGLDPIKSFENLVGKDLAAYEKQWRLWLSRLQKDGKSSHQVPSSR